MRLRYRFSAAIGAVLILTSARAAAPPSAPAYQVNLGLGPGGPNYVPGQVPMWLDTTTMLAGVNGPTPLPRPVSDQSPLPVSSTPASGSVGTGSTVPSYGDVQNFDGSPITGTDPMTGTNGTTAPPPSGTGVRGWLGSIWALLNGTLKVSAQPLSGAWIDASYSATNTATVPTALAATTSRVGFDVENLNSAGGPTACLNWTSPATLNAAGTGCGAGSIPIPAGGARTWDQPGNVSPEAISLICAGTACPLTIKVR